ncbi:SBBP repeat-containing protein [Paenibacillus glycanilyticus]|uniref:DUF11 domain-containing protein n=1 Tax=Paenibacillus glycanilyticus TaxID=126569 RepID=A0ABQ6GJJ4_9BACL|nr:SBBP repeat-containing protein [Paenibacillus glycanilyticus]GLX70373.1 hypothetical protein MU1_47190 [Paenibacillus glycanilyticus]
MVTTENRSSDVQIPCCFLPNEGQLSNPKVHYVSRGAEFEASFTSGEIIFTLFDQTKQAMTRLDFQFLNARTEVIPEGDLPADSTIHSFKGTDPGKWKTGIPTYRHVIYRELWTGIDLVFRSVGRSMKYEFTVHPGADFSDICFTYAGADNIRLDDDGNLVILTAFGEIVDPAPICYQEHEGSRIDVRGSFLLSADDQTVTFRINGPYDRSLPLVIDPGLVYSTYLGGTGNDEPFGIAADNAGNVYVTGITTSTDFPVTPGVVQTVFTGDRDAFITKLNPTGTALVFSTYIGGSASDSGQNVAVDASGNVYVTGRTYSDNFPVTPGAAQPTFGGLSDAFVLKLSPDGSTLLYSTYLGGSGHDYGLGIALDSETNAYVTGFTASANFPVTAGSFQMVYGGANDGFITKFSPSGSLIYSTFLGGTGGDNGTAIAVDGGGNAYVTGNTASTNYPTTPGAFQTSRRGTGDTFVTKLNAAGNALVYSTYLGGSGVDYGYGISVDAAGNAYVAGYTRSTDFPVTPGAYQTTLGGTADIYVTKLNAAGTGLVYSTYLGKSNFQLAYGSGLDTGGNVFVTGYTLATDYPTTPDAIQTTLSGTRDAYATKINAAGNALIFSSYLGGSGIDSGSAIAGDVLGNMYVTGYTFSTDFPVTPGAFQTTPSGLNEIFVTKFGLVPNMKVTKAVDRTDVQPGESVTYFITVNNTGEVALTNVAIADAQLGIFTVIPTLEPGASQTITQPFTVPVSTAPGMLTNIVAVTADQLAQSQTAVANINVASAPSLSFAKSVTPTSAPPGTTVQFTITAENAGNVSFANLTLTDDLLGLHESIDQIGVGTQAVFTVPYTIPADADAGSRVINNAFIQGDNLPRQQAAASVLVLGSPRIEVLKQSDRASVVPGDTINFTITIRNTGNVTLTNVIITDNLTAQSQTLAGIAIGETVQLDVPFLIPLESPPGVYTNTVEVVSDQTTRVTATATVEVLASPLLGIRKIPNANNATPGQTILYRIAVANPGNVPLTGVHVLDPLLGIDTAIPDLAVGDLHELTLPLTVPAAAPVGSSISNLLSVTSNETDPAQVESIVEVTGSGLLLSKKANPVAATPGANVSYTLSVTNLLGSPQTNVTISDPLLGINETLASLPAGGIIIRTASLTVPGDAASGTIITNTFSAVSDQSPLQTKSASIVVQQPPVATTTITLRKRADRNTAAPNETVIFTIEIINTGSNTATNIAVSDSLTRETAVVPLLESGQTAYLQFPFTVPADAVQGTVFTNIVTAVWPERPLGDPPARSFAQVVIGLQRFLLALTNVAIPAVAAPGENAAFIVTVRNNSNQALTNVRVVQPITFFSTLIASLSPGESRSFQQPFTVPEDAVSGTIFTSHAYAFSDQTPLQQAPASVTTAFLPNAALTETVDRPEGHPGDTVFFTIRVRNTGNVVLLNGVLSAPLFNLRIRGARFEIGADYSIRIPFVLPEVPDDTVITSPVNIQWDNGPSLEATASVRVTVDEE